MNDNRFDKIDEKLDRVIKSQNDMNVTLALNTDHLADHMKRTALLETVVAKQTTRIDKIMVTASVVSGLIGLILAIFESGILHYIK